MLKNILHYGLFLMLITLVASGALALVNQATQPKIEAQKALELQQGLTQVLPGSEQGVIVPVRENKDIVYYRGYMQADTTDLIGVAFSAFGKGYSSTIWTLIGMDTTGAILRIRVLDQKETPGLGTKCQEVRPGESAPWFQRQFRGRPAQDVSVDKDGGGISSITGATITSRTITQSIAQRAAEIDTLIQ